MLLLLAQNLAALALGIGLLPVPHRLANGPAWLSLVTVCGFTALSVGTAYALSSFHRQRSAELELLHSAYHDSGTDLPNRAAMEQVLDLWLEAHEPVSLLLLQLCGDATFAKDLSPDLDALRIDSMATQLKPMIRSGDVLAQLGGDGFAILLRGAHTRQALTAFAERVLTLLTAADAPYSGSGQVNIGIASAPADATQGRTLIAMARGAMTLACGAERHGFCFADTLPQDQGYRVRQLYAKLQRAMVSGGLGKGNVLAGGGCRIDGESQRSRVASQPSPPGTSACGMQSGSDCGQNRRMWK